MDAFVLYGELKANTTQFQSALRDSEADLRRTGKAITEQEKYAESLGKATARTARGYEKLREAVNQAQSRLNVTAGAFQKGTATSNQMRAALIGAEHATSRLNSRLADNAARLADSTQKKTSFITKLGLVVGAANLAATAVSALASFLQAGAASVLAYSAKLEQSKVGFETLMGSAAAAQRHLTDLQLFAQKTPFEFSSLVDASQKLQGVGIEARRVIPILTDVGNALAAAGKGRVEIESAVRALSQISAKGKLSAEEVNQLAENGIPAWQILSKELGIAKGEVIKLAEQGKISSEVFLEAFHRFSQENYGDAMEKQSRTFSGAMSNIKDSVMQTSATAFAPLFEQIRTLSVRFSQDIQAQGSNFNAVGLIIAQYIGEGLGQGLSAVVEAAAGYIGNRLKEIFTEGKIIDPISKNLFGGIIQGLGEGFGLLDKKVVFSPWKEATKEVKSTNTELDRLKATLKNTPSLVDKLKAEDAKRQMQALNQIAADLATRFLYFGDETEVAATKQRLLAQGIANFESGVGKTIVTMAGYIDMLKETKKEQDEYASKLKSTSDHMRDLRENARFEIEFPNATPLQQFDFWAKKNAEQFGELRSELEATRRVLEVKNWRQDWDSFTQSIGAAFDDLSLKIDKFKQKSDAKGFIVDFMIKSNIQFEGAESLAKNADTVASAIESYINQIDVLRAKQKGLSADTKEASDAFNQEVEAVSSLNKFLLSLQSKFGNEILRLFGDKTGTIYQFRDAIDALRKSAGEAKLDSIFENLGLRLTDLQGKIISGKTSLEVLQETLSDPAMTTAIQARAEALGMTAEALKKMLLAAATEKTAGDPTESIFGKTGEFFDLLKLKIADFKASLPSIKDALTENITNVVSGIADTFANSIAQWDGTAQGFFKSLAQGFRQMVSQIIAEMVRLLIMKAVMNIIGAFAGGGTAHGGSTYTGIHTGGAPAPGFAAGGFTGEGRASQIAGLVHKKEFVMPFQAVRKFGLNFMESIRNLQTPQPVFAGAPTTNNSSSAVHHHNWNISVSGGQNPQRTGAQIANEAMMKMRKLEHRNK